MDRNTFQLACEALWGPLYAQEAGRQMEIAPRTVQRWDSGETAKIPNWARKFLKEQLLERRRIIDKVLAIL